MADTQRLEAHLFETIADRPWLPAGRRSVAVDLCTGVVEVVRDLALPHPGRATRSAVQLLVGESVPELDTAGRDDLARLCEVAVVCGL